MHNEAETNAKERQAWEVREIQHPISMWKVRCMMPSVNVVTHGECEARKVAQSAYHLRS